jgi:hypothetical protein
MIMCERVFLEFPTLIRVYFRWNRLRIRFQTSWISSSMTRYSWIYLFCYHTLDTIELFVFF